MAVVLGLFEDGANEVLNAIKGRLKRVALTNNTPSMHGTLSTTAIKNYTPNGDDNGVVIDWGSPFLESQTRVVKSENDYPNILGWLIGRNKTYRKFLLCDFSASTYTIYAIATYEDNISNASLTAEVLDEISLRIV